MDQVAARRSPIHHLHEARGADFREVGDSCFAVRIQSEEAETQAKESLAIFDLSGLCKLGVKGRDAESWLNRQGVDVPANIYDTAALAGGGVIARIGAAEFFLEEGIGGSTLEALSRSLDSQDGQTYRVDSDDATFVLVGRESNRVLAQTCSLDSRAIELHRVVYTRVAGVSCGLLVESETVPTWRLWVDPSFAEYLWETLVEICESLKGRVVGAGVVYPQLLQ